MILVHHLIFLAEVYNLNIVILNLSQISGASGKRGSDIAELEITQLLLDQCRTETTKW